MVVELTSLAGTMAREYARRAGETEAVAQALYDMELPRQSDRLAQLTTALGQARTPAAVIEAAVQEPLHALDADAGVVLLIRNDGGTADVVRVVGHRQDAADSARHGQPCGEEPDSRRRRPRRPGHRRVEEPRRLRVSRARRSF